MITEEDLWYFKTTGFYKVRETLPSDLVDQLNEVTSRQIANMREPIVWGRKRGAKARKCSPPFKNFLKRPRLFRSCVSPHHPRCPRRHHRSKRRSTHQQTQPRHGAPIRVLSRALARR